MTATRIAPFRKTQFDGGGYYFKQAAAATFIFGLYLHAARLHIGDDAIVTDRLITPGVDQVFAIIMGYAALAGWLSWPWVVHPTSRHKVIYAVILSYITLTWPLHVATYFRHNTDLLMIFPPWYSVVFLVMVGSMLIFVWRLQIRRP
jgi:hypothetical protein